MISRSIFEISYRQIEESLHRNQVAHEQYFAAREQAANARSLRVNEASEERDVTVDAARKQAATSQHEAEVAQAQTIEAATNRLGEAKSALRQGKRLVEQSGGAQSNAAISALTQTDGRDPFRALRESVERTLTAQRLLQDAIFALDRRLRIRARIAAVFSLVGVLLVAGGIYWALDRQRAEDERQHANATATYAQAIAIVTATQARVNADATATQAPLRTQTSIAAAEHTTSRWATSYAGATERSMEATHEALTKISPTPTPRPQTAIRRQSMWPPTATPRPDPVLGPTRTRPPTSSYSCPNSPPPRLWGLSRAKVTPGLPNNLRAAVESPRILGQIPGRATFRIVDGPVCGEGTGLTWWKVEYNGMIGWTVEGKGHEYWLEPIN